MSKPLKKRKGKNWRRLMRQRLLAKSGAVCFWCKSPLESPQRGYVPKRMTIDHLKRLDDGGTDDIKNLVLSCRACNLEREMRLK